MATTTKPQVPEGLRDLMKDLTREILKEKPTDIYDFAENYFQSRLPQKENYAVRRFEESSGKYDFSYIQNPQCYQVPVALVYSIIPEGLTNLIKELIKAVLREQPQNLCDFAVEYFRHIKTVTSAEFQMEPKEINYSAYENYFMNKERFLFSPYVKCTCGRTLGEAYTYSYNNQNEHFSSIQKIQNNDSVFQTKTIATNDTINNNVSKISENCLIYSEKYMHAVYIIQMYIRRYLKRKNVTTRTTGISFIHHSLDQNSISTITETMPIVPQLQLNQNETENNSEDVSYTSASTAVLSATESGRETSEPSTSESILTKTVIEGVEMENDEQNISDSLKKEPANGHVQVEATTNNKEEANNGKDINIPEENVQTNRTDTSVTQLTDYTTASKNKVLESKTEVEEKSLTENGLECKSNPKTHKSFESNEHGNIDSVISRSASVETFGNDHAEKENISKSEIGELYKESSDIHEYELNTETEVLKKEIRFNLAKDADKVTIQNINEQKPIVEKREDSIERQDKTSKDEQKLSIANEDKDKDGDKTRIKEQKPSLDRQEDSFEYEAKFDKQKVSIAENTTTDLLEEIPQTEMDEIDGYEMDSNNTNSINKSTKNLDENKSKNQEINDKTELLKKASQIKQYEIIKLEDENSSHNKSVNETNEANYDTDKTTGNNKQDNNLLESSQNECHEENAKSISTDNVLLKKDFKKSQTQVDDSFNTNISSKLEKKPIIHDKELETVDTISAILASSPKDDAEIPLTETKEGKLGSNVKELIKNKLVQMSTRENSIEKHADLKLDKEPIIIQTNNNKEKLNKPPEPIKNNFEVKSEKEKIYKVETNTNTETDKPNDILVDPIKQDIAEVTGKDELNEYVEVISQNSATNIGQNSKEIVSEKSQIEITDKDETDGNLIRTSDVLLDHKQSHTHIFVEKQTNKDSGNMVENNYDIDENLHAISQENEKDPKTNHNDTVKESDRRNQEKHLVESFKNEVIEETDTNNSKDTNVDIKLENQVDKSENISNAVNQVVIINKTDKNEIDFNQEETLQGDLNMEGNNTKHLIDKDVNQKSESKNPLLGSIESKATKEEVNNKLEEVSTNKLAEINNTSNDILRNDLDLNKEKESNETTYVSGEKTANYNEKTIPIELDKNENKTSTHEPKHDEVESKTFEYVVEVQGNDKDVQIIKQHKCPTTISLDGNNKTTDVSDDLKYENKSIESQSESQIEKSVLIKTNEKHETVDIQDEAPQPEFDTNKLIVEQTTKDKVAYNIQQSPQGDFHEQNYNSDNVKLNREQQSNNHLTLDLEVRKSTSTEQNIELTSKKVSLKQQSDFITSESLVEHTNQEHFHPPQVESIENYIDLKTKNISKSLHSDDRKNAENSNDIPEVTNQTILESPDKNLVIKSEPQREPNDELKQNTNQSETSQIKQFEISDIIDDWPNKNCKHNSEKNEESNEKPASELLQEITSTESEDKKYKVYSDKVIENNIEAELVQTEANKTEKDHQDMKKIENSITINKSNSLEEPLQIMLNESNNTTDNTNDKDAKDDTKCINSNNNRVEATNKGDQENPQEGSSLNELNYSQIINDDAIDKTFTLKSADLTDKAKVDKNLTESLQTKLQNNTNNIGTEDSTTDKNFENISQRANVALEDCKKDLIEVYGQYMDSNEEITKTSNKQPDQIPEISNNSYKKSEMDSEELPISEHENRVKRETAIETPTGHENKHDDNTIENLSSLLTLNDTTHTPSEEPTNGLQDKSLTDEKDNNEKHNETYVSLSMEKDSERSFEKQLETSKDEISSSNVNTPSKLTNVTLADQNNAANNENRVDIKNPNTVDTTHQLIAVDKQKVDLNSNSSASASGNISNSKDNNDAEENKLLQDDFKEFVATSTNNQISNQQSPRKETTCEDHIQKQPEIFEKEIHEIKSKYDKETVPETQLDGTDNSFPIQTMYEQIDTTSSADEAAGIATTTQIHDSEPKLKAELEMPSAKETVEQTQVEQKQGTHLKVQENESDSKIYDNNSSISLNDFETTDEKQSTSLDSNVVQIETKQIEKYEMPDETEKSNFNEIELNKNFDINSKNSTQNEQDLNDRDYNKNVKYDQSVRHLKHSTTDSKNDDELRKDRSNSYNDNKNSTNSESKELSQISFGSNETDPHNYDRPNSENKTYSNDESETNKELVDKIVTMKGGQKLKEDVKANESEKIQQPDSIENSTNLSESKILTNVLNQETALEVDVGSTDYQLKASLLNSNNNENNISTTENKTLDLTINKLQPSISELQQQNSAHPIKLEDGETNDNKNTERIPLEDEAKTTSFNSTKENEQEISDSSITKHSNEIESSNTEIRNDDPSPNSTNDNKNLNKFNTENTNKDELHSSNEIISVDSNPNIQDSEQIIQINNASNIGNITNTDDQTSVLGDESINLNIIKDISSLTSNEFKCSVKNTESQDLSDQSQQVVVDASNINENASLNHSISEGGIRKENFFKETNSDEQYNKMSVDDKLTRSVDTRKQKETNENIVKTNSEQTLSTDAANMETTIVIEASQQSIGQEIAGETSTDVNGDNTNEQESKHNIGIQIPDTLIGNQNLNIGRIRNLNKGLLGSISGQRFAETHLKSFWKEYVMNNSIPLSQYEYRENEAKEQAISHSIHEVNKTKLADNKEAEQKIDDIELGIFKENMSQVESSRIENNNINRTNDSNPSTDIERIPRYFYGVPVTASNDNSSHSKQKSYKEPTAFTIPMGVSSQVYTTKMATAIEESSTKPNSELGDKLSLAECANAEPLLDAETPTKLFQDLHEFEYEIHDVDLDIAYTIDEIIRLKIENDSQHNSDNDEHLQEISEYSLSPEPMLQTIIELSESETPKPPDQLHLIDDDFLANLEKISDTTSTSWTTGSKEDNSFISDEFLDGKYNDVYSKATPTKSNDGHERLGGIYEFVKDDMVNKEIQSQNDQFKDYEQIIAQAPTPPNDDPFYEDLKKTAAEKIQEAYRQYIQKRILKADKSTSENTVERPGNENNKLKPSIEKCDESTETAGKSNIKNDVNLTSHHKNHNNKYNELKDQESIENGILKKDGNVTATINPVISQAKPSEIENYEETDTNDIQRLIDNSNDYANETKSNTKETIFDVAKDVIPEAQRNIHSSMDSGRNEYINKTRSSCNNINSESKQEPIAQDLALTTLQKDLNTSILSNSEKNISCDENTTHDKQTADVTYLSFSRSNSNIETQKLETINTVQANCHLFKSKESQEQQTVSDPIENFKDGLISELVVSSSDRTSSSYIKYTNGEVNNKDTNEGKVFKSNVSGNVKSQPNNNTNQNLSKSENNSNGHFYFEPTAPSKEDIQSVVSEENLKTNQLIQDQAASKIQKAFKHFIEKKSILYLDLETNTESSKSNWFVGDEPIITKDSLTKTPSEISFEETEAYVEIKTPSQYLVDPSSKLETIDANNFSRSPTAPVSNRSRSSLDLVNNPSTPISKDISKVSVIGAAAGVIENTNTEHTKKEANTIMKTITSTDLDKQEEPSVAIHVENQLTYKHEKAHLIDQFINIERHYTDLVNHHSKENKFTTPDVAEITKILSDFTDSQKKKCDSEIPYECLEEPCIKKSVSRPHVIADAVKDIAIITDAAANADTSSSSDIDDTEDSLSTKTVKLHKPEMAISKMQQRRDSTTKVANLDKSKDYSFDEPLVAAMDNLDTDEEVIVVNKLQREETRESSSQSDVDVIIGGDKDDNFYFLDSITIDETFPSKGSLKRVHTIAGDGDAKTLLKNVTIDESIKYIEPPDFELNSGSLCLDDDTAENIRRKMMAYSLSEADSDCFDKAANNPDSTNSESKTQKYDDFNVSTALVENGDSSTETESTIVSAVTKIQAGARGYLTRKRLGKTSITSDGKSVPQDDINKASFGNAAINESLEHLVQEAAAKTIQNAYRQHYRKKLSEANRNEDEHFSPEFATSMENTLAQKRSIMLQRGDALRNNSTPDEGNSSSNGSGSENGKPNTKIKENDEAISCSDDSNKLEKKNLKASAATKDRLDVASTAKTAAAIRAKKIEENKMRWLAMRQNSMPVQIDSEVLRVIPKHMRKKIKSAEGEKKKGRRRVLID